MYNTFKIKCCAPAHINTPTHTHTRTYTHIHAYIHSLSYTITTTPTTTPTPLPTPSPPLSTTLTTPTINPTPYHHSYHPLPPPLPPGLYDAPINNGEGGCFGNGPGRLLYTGGATLGEKFSISTNTMLPLNLYDFEVTGVNHHYEICIVYMCTI